MSPAAELVSKQAVIYYDGFAIGLPPPGRACWPKVTIPGVWSAEREGGLDFFGGRAKFSPK